MKKVILILLVVATFIASTGIVAHARDIYDTPNADISIDVRIGFDPTNLDVPPPTSPENWIAVTVPDRIALVSNGSTTPSHTALLVVAHSVVNRSAHAVTVSVEGFNLDASLLPYFNTLNLIARDTNVRLINDGILSNLARTRLFTLNGTYFDEDRNPANGDNVRDFFQFTGNLTPPTTGEVVTGNEDQDNTINLHFESHGPYLED